MNGASRRYVFGVTPCSFLLGVPSSAVLTAAMGNIREQILLIGVSYEYYHPATMEVVHLLKKALTVIYCLNKAQWK